MNKRDNNYILVIKILRDAIYQTYLNYRFKQRSLTHKQAATIKILIYFHNHICKEKQAKDAMAEKHIT